MKRVPRPGEPRKMDALERVVPIVRATHGEIRNQCMHNGLRYPTV